jgi:hypothetical protein
MFDSVDPIRPSGFVIHNHRNRSSNSDFNLSDLTQNFVCANTVRTLETVQASLKTLRKAYVLPGEPHARFAGLLLAQKVVVQLQPEFVCKRFSVTL